MWCVPSIPSVNFPKPTGFNLMVPIFVGVLFILVINVSGGYLLQAVVEEKENRTMEIIVTPVSPTQLMAGKVAGNLSVGLTQLFTWAVFPLIAFLIFRDKVPFLSMLEIDSSYIIISLLTLFCAFIMVAAFMAAVGATATEAREAQQVSGLFTLPLVVPYWLMSSMMNNPNGPSGCWPEHLPADLTGFALSAGSFYGCAQSGR